MKRDFTVDSAGILAAQDFLSTLCESPRPQIIMDEIVSNIVRCSGATAFSVDGDCPGDGRITLVFTDDGVAFDPTTEIAAPNLSASADEREVGGLGMFMVRKMSESVSYERRDGKNMLTVVVRL